jgi:hypothetical protein
VNIFGMRVQFNEMRCGLAREIRPPGNLWYSPSLKANFASSSNLKEVCMKRILTLSLVSLLAVTFRVTAIAPEVNRLVLEQQIASLYKQIREKEQVFIAPSPQDKTQFAQFLSQPDTGLFRLLPRDKYQGKISVPGGGAYYSFTRLTNDYGQGSDIELSHGRFSVGFAGYDFGFIALIGDVALESVTMEHPAIEWLNKYTPPSKEPDIRQQQRQSSSGFRQGPFTYTRQVAAVPNTTYLLRSIDYSGTDILVTFRVVKRDVEGSLVILWKKLKTFPAPLAER